VANHFSEAGLVEEAVPFWLKAGQRAIERSANQEAIRHLSKGLECLSLLPESSERSRAELLLQTCLGTALIAARGFSSPEVERVYNRARQLCQHAGETPQLFPVLSGLWFFYTSRGEHSTARELAEHSLRIAQNVGDKALLVQAHHIVGVGLLATGDFVQALNNLELLLAQYDAQHHRSLVYTYGHDPAAVGLTHMSWVLWFLGYPDQALTKCQEGETLAQKLNHPYTSLTVAAFAMWVYQFTRNTHKVEELASQSISISTEHGFVFYRAYGLIMRGWALVESGLVLEGLAQIRDGLDEYRTNGGASNKPYFFALLGEAYGKLGQFEQALNALAEAQGVADENEERWCQAELYRIKGELTLRRRDPGSSLPNSELDAERCFHQAIDVARTQKARSFELRAAMSLCRLWKRQSRSREARTLLGGILHGFTEGFQTPDLRDAKLLMKAMQ
jgi:predicted ATPase